MAMKKVISILVLMLAAVTGCVTQFFPDISEESYSIVIEGRVTDRSERYEVRISWLQPLNSSTVTPQVSGYLVTVSDDVGNEYLFTHYRDGRYLSDSTEFRAVAGRKYTLHVEGLNQAYESEPVELTPVPSIDSVYAGPEYNEFYKPGESTYGYQVYLDSYDPSGKCRFYMWSFTETWEIRYPYDNEFIKNRICWKSATSADINILSTSSLTNSRVIKHPVTFITRETDRLIVKYSILVRQYSVSEDEFIYRDNLRKNTLEAGGLYDAIPGAIKGNIKCVDSPGTEALGFFGASSVADRRLFIENVYTQFPDFFAYCRADTIPVRDYDPSLYGSGVYILAEWWEPPTPPQYILTVHRECIDCAFVGTALRPEYWDDPDRKTIYHSLFDEQH